jgi:hypothetical protein
MFGTESIRLLRDDWKVPKMLAEELYAIFNDDAPVSTAGGLTVTAPTGVAPITIGANTEGAYSPAFSFGSGSDAASTGWNPNTGEMQYNSPSGFNFTFPGTDGLPQTVTIGPMPDALNNQQPEATGGGMPGMVTGGSGSTYQATVYPEGLGGDSLSVAVTQMSIDPDATIPAGTWTTVLKNGTGSKASYSMQVPVWGSDPS